MSSTLRAALTLWDHKILVAAILIIGQAVPLMACDPQDRSVEENQEQVGWQERGRNPGSFKAGSPQTSGAPGTTSPGGQTSWQYELHYSDVILSPDGQNLLAMVPVPGPDQGFAAPALALVVQPLPAGAPLVFDEILNLERINFSPDGRYAYLLRSGGRKVTALDLHTMTIGTTWLIGGAYSALDVTPDGRFLVASNLPTNDIEEIFFEASDCWSGWNGESINRCQIGVVDLLLGKTWQRTFELPIRDLDFSPVHGEVLLTASTLDSTINQNLATVWFFDLGTNALVQTIEFPNCADELKIQPGGALALLSPTHCSVPSADGSGSQDPISVIDLESRTFVANLPGFGPVDISADGKQAVGFTRRQDMIEVWGYQQVLPVGLIVVDLDSLEWKVIEYGAREPAYLLSPDGSFIYAHDQGTDCRVDRVGPGTWQTECGDPAGLQRISVATGAKVLVDGPEARLDRFVVGPDQKSLYLLHEGGLLRLDFGTAALAYVQAPTFGAPDLLNIRPQGDVLVLGYSNQPWFHLLPLSPDVPSSFLPLVIE